MIPGRWERIKALFDAALDRPPEERAAFLAESCGEDHALLIEVMRLVAADEESDIFLDRPVIQSLGVTHTVNAPEGFVPGEIVSGRYRIVRLIGHGGMGQVYEAVDMELKEGVALKTIRSEIATDKRAILRFKREILTARSVRHPNVCGTFDLGYHSTGTGSKVTFLTMELLSGEVLSDRLKRVGRMTTTEALPIVQQLAAGLEAAHQAGIIHRDFKPGNVILVSQARATHSLASTESARGLPELGRPRNVEDQPVLDPREPRQNQGGSRLPGAEAGETQTGHSVTTASREDAPELRVRAVITDFGLARRSPRGEGTVETTSDGPGFAGTPDYMAPEQMTADYTKGGEVTPATDIYGLGVVMYQMVTGALPFTGDTPFAAALRKLHEKPPPPSSHVPGLDSKWEATILRCLERNPADRFASAADVVKALAGKRVAAETTRRTRWSWALALAQSKPPLTLDLRNRLAMLKRVREDWIDGVLNQSLYKVARIELNLEASLEAVELPLNALIQVPDRTPAMTAHGTAITEVFDNLGEALLILGAPGTGKTTLLLELAQGLLDRAAQDQSHPIPVVFNLSSWAVKRQPLASWLVDELHQRSDVPKKLAQRWVDSDEVLPLLDGLDEVDAPHRQACVEAINQFRSDHGLLPIAVCSRTADYESSGAKLRLRNAVVVQPLTRSQTEGYLARSAELRPLFVAAKEDSSFAELLETPLMLWVAMLAYQNIPVANVRGESVEQARRRLFATFVAAMFRRRSVQCRYRQVDTLRWLLWLASTLDRSKQTVFRLENLHPDWLLTRGLRPPRSVARISINAICGVIGGLVCGPIVGLVSGVIGGLLRPTMSSDVGREFGGGVLVGVLVLGGVGLFAGLLQGPIWGLLVGLLSAFIEPQPVDMLHFHFSQVRSRLPVAMRSALWVWLIGGLTGLIFALVGLIGWLSMWTKLPSGPGEWLKGSLLWGSILGLATALIIGLVRLVATEEVAARRTPNQGIRNSVKNALVLLLAATLFGVTASALFPRTFFLTPIAVGVTVVLIGGGLFAIRHFVLRLLLWAKKSAPLNYVPFLDYAAERLFLRKVGGGYMFTHRMLLEYFASLRKSKHTLRSA